MFDADYQGRLAGWPIAGGDRRGSKLSRRQPG